MIPAGYLIVGVLFVALLVYVLTGGADFGGGVWDLFAFGPRKSAQRQIIADAIAPIWEANHVWLIVVVVVFFVCFPKAFALTSTALHVPLSIMLIGIVLRGTAFVFRAHDSSGHQAQRRWGVLFAVGSIITPLMLGISLATLSSGAIQIDATGQFTGGFFAPWLKPFPLLTGLFAVITCAFLAALYLIFETNDKELRRDFRLRALASALFMLVFGLLALNAARDGAPLLYARLISISWSVPLLFLTVVLGFFTTIALYFAYDAWARILGIALVAALFLDWGMSHFPYLVVDAYTVENTAAPNSVLYPVLWTLGFGSLLLVPSFVFLYVIFKRRREPNHRVP